MSWRNEELIRTVSYLNVGVAPARGCPILVAPPFERQDGQNTGQDNANVSRPLRRVPHLSRFSKGGNNGYGANILVWCSHSCVAQSLLRDAVTLVWRGHSCPRLLFVYDTASSVSDPYRSGLPHPCRSAF